MSATEGQLTRWYALELVVDRNAREAVEYALMEADALGTETNDADDNHFRVTAYFEGLANREKVRLELAEALRIYDLPSSSIGDMSIRAVENQDWLNEWKKSWRPVETNRFIIAPSWLETVPHDRILVRIEPGMAFGTGTHETTLLCLAAIERHFAGGSFLDVGTGSGILAIAAAKLFPDAAIRACDTDEEALEIARQNARLNEASDRIEFKAGSVDDSTPSADFVCANLTAEVIDKLLRKLLAITCGRLVLSGILDSQVEFVVARLRECGVSNPIETMRDGEWAAMVI